MNRNEAIAQGVVELDKCFNKAERDAVFGRLYDAGFAAAQEWHKASEKPKRTATYQVTQCAFGDLGGVVRDAVFRTEFGEWDINNVTAWRELPLPFVPEEAQR